jgi:hypothetical protein
MRGVSLLLLPLLLAACSGEDVASYGPRDWSGMHFVVEGRPVPLRAGMNEFIVIATGEHDRPGVNFVVSLRVGDHGEWHQAIQDGYTGVYRRAVRVTSPKTDVLQVQVRKARSEEQTVLSFPLGRPG